MILALGSLSPPRFDECAVKWLPRPPLADYPRDAGPGLPQPLRPARAAPPPPRPEARGAAGRAPTAPRENNTGGPALRASQTAAGRKAARDHPAGGGYSG
ncbi:hypothetical protein P7K49_008541, partial [Saguinus oedipus]